MSEYKGAASEGARSQFLEKQREKMFQDIARQKLQIEKDTQVRIGADKFVAQHDFVESELKRQTVGLVQLEDFERIKETLDTRRKEELEKMAAAAAAASSQKRKKKRDSSKMKLSFGDDEEAENGADDEKPQPEDRDGDSNERTLKKPKLKKDPTVDTSFLPDKERDEDERRIRQQLKEEWEAEQEKIKQERIIITYSYWDGSGHRKQVEVKKGDTISQFLEACRQQWHQLRGVSVDNLMYVKEDLIVPHHWTFYEFIVNKTRGKSGPLFAFDVHDDVRLTNDASIETEESHAGKIIERAWYEKNKHIFPASRWEVFDPRKDYGKYSIKDKNKDKDKLPLIAMFD